jgi:hypothetical protein
MNDDKIQTYKNYNNNKIINKKIFLTVDKENKGGLYYLMNNS